MARNQRLADAIVQRGWDNHALADAIGVDTKTVARWVTTARPPHPRLRRRAAEVLGVPVAVLWPEFSTPADGIGELVALYPTRAAVSPAMIQSLLAGATAHVDVLAYAGLWLFDAVPRFAELLVTKIEDGVAVRLCLGDPTSPAVRERGEEEGIGANLGARCELAITYATPIADADSGAVRISGATLYASILRFDDDLLVNVHLYGNPAAASPVLHVQQSDAKAGVARNVINSFERVWNAAQPVRG